jgi:hypothetical protein
MILRHMLRLELSPFQSNVASCAVVVLYFKACLEAVYRLRARNWITAHYSRDLVHVLMSTSVAFWTLFDPSDWSWRLAALVPAVLLARFLYKVRGDYQCHETLEPRPT